MKWYDKKGVCDYSAEQEADVRVLYIGGGNAFCIYHDKILYQKIN